MTRILIVLALIAYSFHLLLPSLNPQTNTGASTSTATPRSTCAEAAIGPMVLIPGATTHIGIDLSQISAFERLFAVDHADLFQSAAPNHSVTLHDFSIDACLVTNAQFQRFVDANPQWQPGHLAPGLDNGNYLLHWKRSPPIALPDHPVTNVNWYAAVAYCRWVGKRLPAEAEWEYAARGGLNSLFPWGDEFPDASRANFSAAHIGTTSAVASYPPNRYGLYDMAGNVWQFLSDEYQPYPPTVQINPIAGGDLFSNGPSFMNVKTRRVIRGGSYDGAPINLWVEYRDSHPPDGSRDFVGFRCAK